MYGIALEGGGAKGAYQLGAWKALNELGIEYNGIVGTSIGTINAALMIQSDIDIAYNVWNNMGFSASKNMGGELAAKMASHEFNSRGPIGLKNEMKEVFGTDGIDITAFKNEMKKTINEKAIRESKIDFGLVTISLKQQRGLELFKEDIPEGRLSDYIVASCCLPVFKSIEIDGDYFLDGSYYNQIPTNMLIKKGYKNIIEIRLYPPKPEQIQYSDVNIITVYPKEYLGKTLDFSKELALKNIERGYRDTIDTFRNL